ncbi:glycosyltransferase family 8 protein [uncultured Tateyamaria sp.]|uniref:glycosyltransferase family 8 protein n=1 Tax=uncultured Tateyamaria sp. TaxID=455651 RepID=UPI002623D4D6|nr:glycosyltransferase family 8 protein [uncultured Tateyamaria sp.]
MRKKTKAHVTTRRRFFDSTNIGNTVSTAMLPDRHLMNHPRIPTLPEEVLANIAAQKARAHDTLPQIIHVVLAIDETYAPHAAVTIASALDHAGHPERLNFYILEDGSLSDTIRKNLSTTARNQLIFVPVNTETLTDLPLNRPYISRATYYRLAMHKVLPKSIQKILYIDSDTVVTDALEHLWSTPLNGYPIGACPDEGGLTQSARLGLPSEHLYFNAGVAIFDLNAIRALDFDAALATAYETHKERITLQDQDLLNLVFCGQTQSLPLRWNAGTRLYLPSEVEAAYTPQEALEAANAPGILHFTDRRKPWMLKDLNPLGHLYWTYRNQTPWAETALQTATRHLKKALRHRFSSSQKTIDADIIARRAQ